MRTQAPAERTLTQIDYVRLTRLVSLSEPRSTGAIRELLENSDLVASPAVPATVITMYSQMLVQDVTDGEPCKVTLCYPDDAEPSEGFISVLSPMGASLLGLRVGDVAQWRTPRGNERMALVVEVLFQPEASGDFTT
ncbi:MAG: GreA/GreB family elongation factor [Ramlibacter sp.]